MKFIEQASLEKKYFGIFESWLLIHAPLDFGIPRWDPYDEKKVFCSHTWGDIPNDDQGIAF